MMIDLTVLVCSVHTRFDTFLINIERQLFGQYEALSVADQARVEIIVLADNKKQVLGHKRNLLVGMAQGNYIVFVDDDDRVSDDYIVSLLEATSTGADSIVFDAMVTLNGDGGKLCNYSKEHKRDYNSGAGYYRIPNHICCIKRSVSLNAKFPDILFGEDAAYSKDLLPFIKTEHRIDRVLYYYDYDPRTTETRPATPQLPELKVIDTAVPASTGGPAVVDVVILSKADQGRTHLMTQRAIDSCIAGAGNIPVNIIVIEGGVHSAYKNATVIEHRVTFNYNKFANLGASNGSAEWIMVANNDLVFNEGWLEHLLAANNDVVSPREPSDPRQSNIKKNTSGYVTSMHFSGWCFMIRRTLWDKIGGFDTDVSFWCSDDAVIEQVKAEGVMPMLVYKSVVDHFTSITLRSLPRNATDNMKWSNVYIFNKKYNKFKFIDSPDYQRWLRRYGK